MPARPTTVPTQIKGAGARQRIGRGLRPDIRDAPASADQEAPRQAQLAIDITAAIQVVGAIDVLPARQGLAGLVIGIGAGRARTQPVEVQIAAVVQLQPDAAAERKGRLRAAAVSPTVCTSSKPMRRISTLGSS